MLHVCGSSTEKAVHLEVTKSCALQPPTLRLVKAGLESKSQSAIVIKTR